MISVEVKKKGNEIYGFHVEGHAGYSEYGTDIVCAAVSVLVINCINSIERLTQSKTELKEDEEAGMIDFTVSSYQNADVKLLLQSLQLGIRELANQYGKEYITFH